MSQWLTRLREVNGKCFSKYLLYTNTAICISSSGLGDSLQQKYEKIRGRKKQWDSKRFFRVACTGCVIGPACHFWYQWLDRVLPGITKGVLCKKIFLDQVIFSPINISLFLVTMGIFEGMKRQEIFADLKQKGIILFKAESLIWPPAQAVNFYFVPPRFRVLYDSTVSLAFDNYYSYVKFRLDKDKKEEQTLVLVCDNQDNIRTNFIENNEQNQKGENHIDSSYFIRDHTDIFGFAD